MPWIDGQPLAASVRQRGQRAEQALRVRMLRLVEQSVDVACLDDLARVHHDDRVGTSRRPRPGRA